MFGLFWPPQYLVEPTLKLSICAHILGAGLSLYAVGFCGAELRIAVLG